MGARRAPMMANLLIMTNFMEIATPFHRLTTVRLEKSGDFRPSATGDNSDIDNIKLRVLMEQLEIDASTTQKPGFISSAAHSNRVTAIQNAQFEAIERISLAAWWTLKRPIIAKVPLNTLETLVESYEPKQDIHASIGFVEPINKVGFAALSILSHDSTYPYTALGGAYSHDVSVATEKAFIESVQSWTASKWLYDHNRDSAPLWDVAELSSRRNEIESTEATETSSDKGGCSIPGEQIVVSEVDDTYVAWIYGKEPVSGTSVSLAKLAMRPNDNIRVFTNHNL